MLPSDVLSDFPIAYLSIPLPKSRWRGSREQHASTRDADFIALLEKRFAGLKPTARLFTGTAHEYRKVWDKILAALHVPAGMFTPGCLRGGGCCHSFLLDKSIETLMWRMRITSAATLRHYLQEVVATSSLCTLTDVARSSIHIAAKIYKYSTLGMPAQASHSMLA